MSGGRALPIDEGTLEARREQAAAMLTSAMITRAEISRLALRVCEYGSYTTVEERSQRNSEPEMQRLLPLGFR